MKQLRVIVSSTRPSRVSAQVAQWVAAEASEEAWNVEMLDLAELALPLLDEEDMPRNGNYALPHTKAWAEKVAAADAVAIVTPEYNASIPAPLKNAIDMLYAEWNDLPVGVVAYGWHGGEGASTSLGPILASVGADLRGAVNLTFMKDLEPTGGLIGEGRTTEVSGLIAKLA